MQTFYEFAREAGTVPEDLRPFVEDRRHPGTKRPTPSIQFLVSERIVTPAKTEHDWHLAPPIAGAIQKFRTIQAPAQYGAMPLTSLHDVNRMAKVEADPGPCIVCRGVSGERVHIAPLYVGQSVYPMGSICRACTPAAFAAWQRILDTPV